MAGAALQITSSMSELANVEQVLRVVISCREFKVNKPSESLVCGDETPKGPTVVANRWHDINP